MALGSFQFIKEDFFGGSADTSPPPRDGGQGFVRDMLAVPCPVCKFKTSRAVHGMVVDSDSFALMK
jgi:hypothetical protein